MKTGVSQSATANEWERKRDKEKAMRSHATEDKKKKNIRNNANTFALINVDFSIFQIEISILRNDYTVNRARIIV